MALAAAARMHAFTKALQTCGSQPLMKFKSLALALALMFICSNAHAHAQEDGSVDSSTFEACSKQSTHASPSKENPTTSSPAPGRTKEETSKHGQEDVKTPVAKSEADGVKTEAGGVKAEAGGEGQSNGGPGPSSQAGAGSQQQKEAGPSPAAKSGQDVQALVAKTCKPYAGGDLEWHPVTPDVGKTTTEGPRCCQDIRASKGTISSFFKPKQQQPASKQEGSAMKRERQDDKDGGDAKRSKP